MHTALTQSIAVFCVQSTYHDIDPLLMYKFVTHLQHYPGDEKQGQGKTHEHHSVYVLLVQEKCLIMMSVLCCLLTVIYKNNSCVPANAVRIGVGETV